ncbi:MAG: hypothetical protein AAEJ53_20510 [Myxococcota bacterium]
MSPPKYTEGRLGYRFRGGKLYAREEARAYVLHGWPELVARHKRALNSRYADVAQWADFDPAFRVVRPYRPAKRGKPSKRVSERRRDGEQLGLGLDLPPPPPEALPLREQKRRAFAGFRFAIPKQVARLVEPLRGQQWPVLQLLRDHEAACEIMAANPALVFGLALAKQGVRRRTYPWLPAIDDLLRRKQRDILQYIELPGTKQAARLLSRVPTRCLYPRIFEHLARIFSDPAATKLAAHLPTLNVGAVRVIASYRCRDLATPRFLEELTELPREFHYPFVYTRMVDMHHVATEARFDLYGRSFRSVAQMESTWQELAEAYRTRAEPQIRSSNFPLPPIPGTREIQPITTPAQLIDEGDSQHNCVASYAPIIVIGWRHIYRVLAPERATLSIVREPDGKWVIGELEAAYNTPVSPETHDVVRAWLKKSQRQELSGK